MSKIIFIAAMLLSSICFANPPEFAWSYEYNVSFGNIMAVRPMNHSQVENIQMIFWRSSSLFFNIVEKNIDIINTCKLDKLEIKIVPNKMLNNKKLFKDHDADEVFGRYYWRVNKLYVSRQVFNNPEYLAHELAHYFYDECKIFKGVQREEEDAYKFQDLYAERFKTR